MTTIQVKCDLTDSLARYIVKENAMKQWPALYRHATLQYLKLMILIPQTVTFVVELDNDDNSDAARPVAANTRSPNNCQIIGWVIWTRVSTRYPHHEWRETNLDIGTRLEASLQAVRLSLFELFNPLTDHEHLKTVSHIMRSDFERSMYPEYWQLQGCYVDPEWQRKGVGRLALEWGMSQARMERVPILMKASPAGLELYERAGFVKLEKEEFDMYFETGGQGFWKMKWEPENLTEHTSR